MCIGSLNLLVRLLLLFHIFPLYGALGVVLLLVEIDPADAMTFEKSSFAPTKPFVALPGHSIELMDGGQWRTGGASFGEAKEGDDALGPSA